MHASRHFNVDRKPVSELSPDSRPPAYDDFSPRSYRRALWLPGPHAQTVIGRLLRPTPRGELRRVRLDTPDGDFLDLDLAPDPGPGAPVVLVLHGLEGSTARRYMRLAFSELANKGVLAVGLNFRSCSGTMNRLARFYHSGETGDLDFVLTHLRDRFPDRRIGTLGFSLGGNVLLRYLGEQGEAARSRVDVAAAISVPYDLTEGTRLLETGPMGRVYTHYFLKSLQRKARLKAPLLSGVVDLDRILAARTLREFDEAATAPLHGYASAWEYYRAASSGPVLPQIRVPTLLLHALDDPFLPAESIPHEAVRKNPWLLGSFQPAGGHVGFVEAGPPWRPRFWAESEAARFLSAILKER